MSFINKISKEIYCKVLYVGPPQSGKTTQYSTNFIRKLLTNKKNLNFLSLPLEAESTTLFDFLPLSIGKIRDFSTRFHLYTIPGDMLFKTSSKIIFKRAGRYCLCRRFRSFESGSQYQISQQT